MEIHKDRHIDIRYLTSALRRQPVGRETGVMQTMSWLLAPAGQLTTWKHRVMLVAKLAEMYSLLHRKIQDSQSARVGHLQRGNLLKRRA